MYILVKGLEDYMLPCVNKKLFGFECMGCGLQRSALLLLQGDLFGAFMMYPAIYTLITLFGFILINSFKNFKNGSKIIAILAITNVAVIVISYLLKLYFK